ncbi:N-acetylneuraminate lyase [Psychromarinibacter sp. C21-152]|uniref:N-acetylneuraminate lyase n=1 Tax=Psychromarinibacter sediminicola TaxID=3033385 RepID=A0AAE3NPV0_9RHOB|nr:N-acetylneuraminate lyase [Psychromarinibacter sediminicola]MDF0599832.1 N-acetylneuraminate lyase [Psychromarinibacter sediminicola]
MALRPGIYTSLLTPFAADESIDVDAALRLIDLQQEHGVDGLYVGGSSGEAMLQSRTERADYLTAVSEAAGGRFELIAHVGAASTADVLALAETAAESGYAAVSAISPFYYPFSRSEVIAHYCEIADAAALPLVIYNFPAISAAFTMDEFKLLLSHPNIAGLKHTSSDMYQLERIRTAFPETVVYNGYDEMFVAGMASGAQGGIGTTYNFMGDLFMRLASEIRADRMDEARRLQRIANTAIDGLIRVGVMPGAKAILELMGVGIGQCRRPFRKLVQGDREVLAAAIRPLLDWRAEG